MTMLQMSDGAALLAVARRAFQWLVLDRAGLAPFVLGVPALQQRPDHVQPAEELAVLLVPYRGQLWRRRALLVLRRLGIVAAVYVLALGLLRLCFVPGLPWFVCWAPALALLGYGCVLARRQRPGLGETACLLDRRYGLHEVLGTAAEMGSSGTAGGLAALTLTHAIDLAKRLPERAWENNEMGRARRLLVPALVAAAVGVWIAGAPAAATSRLAREHLPAPRTDAGLAQVMTHQEPALPRARQAETHPAPRSVRVAVPSNSFAASLQTHAGPPIASAPVAASSQAPVTTLRGQLGAGPGGTQNGAAPSLGGAPRSVAGSPSGKSPIAQAAPPSSGQRQAPHSGSGSGSGGGGQSQQAQQGNSATGAPGGQAGSANGQRSGGSVQADPSEGSPGAAPPGAPGQQGANPFGQDPRPASGGSQTTRRSGASGARGAPGTNGQQRRQTTAGNQHSPSSRDNAAASDALDSRQGRHGTGSDSTRQQASTTTRQAGAASGPEVVLGSGRASQAQIADPQLVRVLPSGSRSLSSLQSSGQLGPQRVEGYVPEDATLISPAEQSLLLAYFAQQGGS